MSFTQVPSELWTTPPVVTRATTDDLPVNVDFSGQLASFGSATATTPVTVTLLDQTMGTTVTLTDQPTLSGNVVSQRIRAGVLVASNAYLVWATCAVSGTTDVLTAFTAVQVPL